MGLQPDVAQRLIADAGDDKFAFGATFVPPAQLAQIQQNAAVKERLVTSAPGALAYLAMNTKRGALANLEVRKAIQYAVDKQAFQVADGGSIGGGFATTLITPGIHGREEFDLYQAPSTGDPDKAKRCCAAGEVSSLNLSLLVTNDSTALAQAQAIQQGLKRAGITVTHQAARPDRLDRLITGDKPDFDLVLAAGCRTSRARTATSSRCSPHRRSATAGYNISRYSNPAVDKLIDEATAETDQTAAEQLWVAGRQADHGRRSGRPADLHPQLVPARVEGRRTSSSRRSRRTRTTSRCR